MNNDELLQKAKDIIATRRQKAHAFAMHEMQKAEKELPQITDLLNQKSEICIKAATLAASGANSEEVTALLDKAKQIEIQREQILKNAGYDNNILLPKYECEICKDTGILNGKYCECLHKLTKRMKRDELNAKSPLSLCRFEDFDVSKYPNEMLKDYEVSAREHMNSLFSYCKAYAQNFSLKNTSLYMCGFAGLGKTHLALSIANVVLEKGYDVVYVSAQDAFDKIEKERFAKNEDDTLQTMLSAQLLILDDLGTEFITPYISACLYNLVNARKQPTIYTSNIVNDADLRRRYTEKVVSRLLGNCEVLTFCGEDIRLQGK